ncbi:hypothetical protein ACJDU8_23480 [Clostridium sp. WILCCON 0269]|uniref:Lipoprotein n=1 Tax=Candidatus Clostridium eludens TaxID=3381663 RepID=A0ABW8ST85_9CLOT
MKKRLLLIITTLFIIINLVGCGTSTVKNKVENAPNQAKNDLMKLPNDLQADMGTGSFYISTSSGTSKNGATPIIYTKKDTQVEQLELNTSGFNGKNLSYIFVDSALNTKHQLSDSKLNINLKGNELTVGKHRVDIVQFNNKTNDKVITHKVAYYEIKTK